MKYLFTAQTSNDLGLLTRSLPVASELVKREHQVAFTNPAAAPSRVIDEAGFDNLLLKHPLHYISALQARWEFTQPGLVRQVQSGAIRREYGSLGSLLAGIARAAPTHFHSPVTEVWSIDTKSLFKMMSIFTYQLNNPRIYNI